MNRRSYILHEMVQCYSFQVVQNLHLDSGHALLLRSNGHSTPRRIWCNRHLYHSRKDGAAAKDGQNLSHRGGGAFRAEEKMPAKIGQTADLLPPMIAQCMYYG